MSTRRIAYGALILLTFVAFPHLAQANQWYVQEFSDTAQFTGCWCIVPANYSCTGQSHLVDGDYETGSFSYLQGHDAVLQVGYHVPDGAEVARWVVEYRQESGSVITDEFPLDLDWIDSAMLNLRITVTNTGSVGSPFEFEFHDGEQWVSLLSGNTNPHLVSAIIFEERVEWFGSGTIATEGPTWDQVKTLYR